MKFVKFLCFSSTVLVIKEDFFCVPRVAVKGRPGLPTFLMKFIQAKSTSTVRFAKNGSSAGSFKTLFLL